jgi:hypothetical protein
MTPLGTTSLCSTTMTETGQQRCKQVGPDRTSTMAKLMRHNRISPRAPRSEAAMTKKMRMDPERDKRSTLSCSSQLDRAGRSPRTSNRLWMRSERSPTTQHTQKARSWTHRPSPSFGSSLGRRHQ